MHKRRSDGLTLHQHYMKALGAPVGFKAVKAKAKQELTPPPLPPASEHYLQLFYDLNNTRSQGMNGYEPLSWLEVEAYLRLTKQDIEPWEVRLLKRMDSAWLRAAADEGEQV